jgi:ABC-type multidrug transport system ATPase subunit
MDFDSPWDQYHCDPLYSAPDTTKYPASQATDSITPMLISTVLLQTKTLKPLMEVKGLNGGPDTLLLFKDMDLRLPAGVSALLGDEGSGKTSLLRLLSGDLVAKSGQLCVLGVDVPLPTPTPGWVFWTDLRLPLNDEFTPAQCWDAFARNWPEWSEATQKALVKTLQLTPHMDKRLNMLSTGSRRKVGLVAALASGAKVTLLDQPFVSLDQSSIRDLKEILTDFGRNPQRAYLIADYEKPTDMPLAAVLTIEDSRRISC